MMDFELKLEKPKVSRLGFRLVQWVLRISSVRLASLFVLHIPSLTFRANISKVVSSQ
jgi:hypothetical protein